jgi:hypothetical protein
LDTELSAKYKIQASGALGVPVLTYSLGIINWQQEKLRKLDRKTRKLLTIQGQHHPKAAVDQRKGLMQLEEAYIIEITKLMGYVDSTEDQLIQIVRTHQNNTKSAMVETARCLRTGLKKGTRKRKDKEKTKETWQAKRMYGQIPRSLDENWWIMNSRFGV